MNFDSNSDVTVIISSCGRFDLLEKTLDSFLSWNSYPLKKILISEDSGKLDMKNKILSKYGNTVELIFNETNLGLLKSLDNLYSKVDTKYVFQIEDDWKFSNHKNFIQESKNVLEERKDIHQVWIRIGIPNDWIENKLEQTSNNTLYKMVKQDHCGGLWCGFSFNPSLKRLEDYKNMFQNGYNVHATGSTVQSEYACNLHVRSLGYRAAQLENKVCLHIGDGRSTY